MHKKVFGLLLALPLALNGIAVCAAPADDKGNERMLPTGFSDYKAIKLTEEELQDRVMVSPQRAEMTTQSAGSLPSFYEYGSDYGYNYLGTLENGAAMQDCYNKLKDMSITFAGSTDDAIGYVLGGPDDVVYSLSFEAFEMKFDELLVNDAIFVYYTFRQDHPGYYWLSSELLYAETYEGRAILVPLVDSEYVKFSTRSKLNDVMDKNFKTMLANAKKMPDRYMTIKQIHDDICAATDYGWEDIEAWIPLEESPAHNIQGVLDGDGEADSVCESYAKTAQLLMNAVGIPNILVNGEANYGNHVWNAAMLDDGRYYYFDVTWDDGIDSLGFFAKGSTGFAGRISFENYDFYYDGKAYPGMMDDESNTLHYPYYKELMDMVAYYGLDFVPYFQCGLPEISATDYVYTSITQTGGSYNIGPDKEIPKNYDLYVAQYDSKGALIKVKKSKQSVTVVPEKNTVEIKAFILNNRLQPLTAVKRVEVN
ncbi:MAG: hypothetical protein J1G06_02025 [Oscillospiraceae bacterium]|nr:hypothetical protein [Oscillospiraceae bacterium]